MDSFDINIGTILVFLILGHLSTGLLIVSYKAKRSKSKAVDLFLLSKLFQLVAWTMFGLRDVIPDLVMKIAGNFILFTGAVLELTALLILKNSYTKTIKKVCISLMCVCIAVFIAVTAYNTAISVRIAFASVTVAILMAFPVYVLFTDRNSSLLQKVIASFYGITILVLLCRTYAALRWNLDMQLESTNIFNIGLLLWLYLVMLAGSVGFVLLDKEKMDVELHKAASFDELTEIFNRRTFILRAKEMIPLHAGKQKPFSFLLMDIDDFKKVNDKHGHYVGDIVLKYFADTVKKHLRDTDLFGRYGGEEFAVLLPGTDGKEAVEVAERLRKAIEDTSIHTRPGVKYTVSIGVAAITPDMDANIDLLYKLSDDALYSAKMQGKNRVVWLQK